MADKIQTRRGTASEWNTSNPTLAAGEMGLEQDTKKLKIGDGTTGWNSLKYLSFDGGDLDGATALGILPVGRAGGQGDPFFSLQRISNCPNNQIPFWAQWEDNGENCIDKMLFVHLVTQRYTLTIYHTNKMLPGVGGSVIDSVQVVHNGQTTTYNSTDSLNTRFNGDIALQLVSSSFQPTTSSSSSSSALGTTLPPLVSFLQMRFSWVSQINDVVTLGGGVAVVLKKVINEGGYWETASGPQVNGFGLAGGFLNITRADLESAALQGPGTTEWNKVMFPGTDFNSLNVGGPCRNPWPPETRIWDPIEFPIWDSIPCFGSECSSSSSSSSSNQGCSSRATYQWNCFSVAPGFDCSAAPGGVCPGYWELIQDCPSGCTPNGNELGNGLTVCGSQRTITCLD